MHALPAHTAIPGPPQPPHTVLSDRAGHSTALDTLMATFLTLTPHTHIPNPLLWVCISAGSRVPLIHALCGTKALTEPPHAYPRSLTITCRHVHMLGAMWMRTVWVWSGISLAGRRFSGYANRVCWRSITNAPSDQRGAFSRGSAPPATPVIEWLRLGG